VENVKLRLSDQFRALALECEQEVLTMGEFITALGVRGHAFLALLFSVPFILPIPLPGLSVVFGLFVLISGLGISFNFKLWLPAWMMRRSLPGHLLAKVFRASASLMQKIEKILKPRLFSVSESMPVRLTAGFLIAMSGAILALPLPPGTNFPPAGVCVLLSLGILERDGFFMIGGFLAFILQISVIVGLLIYAREWMMSFF
jgi:hypothetical protein